MILLQVLKCSSTAVINTTSDPSRPTGPDLTKSSWTLLTEVKGQIVARYTALDLLL